MGLLGMECGSVSDSDFIFLSDNQIPLNAFFDVNPPPRQNTINRYFRVELYVLYKVGYSKTCYTNNEGILKVFSKLSLF